MAVSPVLVDPVVDRWITQPRAGVAASLRGPAFAPEGTIELDGGALRFDDRFEQFVDSGRTVWRAPARLVMHGLGAVRFARVDVEVIAWSDDVAEVTVRSRARHVVTWGERREQRYFMHAHDAATHIARLLSTATAVAA
jgi:hypothetical protein